MDTISGAALVKANGATFHVEVTGHGRPLLLVPGAGGDCRQYAGLAQILARNHSVIAYDRRNNGRSPRQSDWSQTSVDQHAGDAIALLETLGAEPCVVFGNSTGALIALAAAIKAPAAFTGVVLHEPALLGVLTKPDDAVATVQPVIAGGVESGGLAGGAEAFVRFAAADAAGLLPLDFLDALRTNARVLLEAEFGAFASWRPEAEALSGMNVPLAVLTAEQTAPFFVEAAEWIASQIGVNHRSVPGGHMGFLNHPTELANEIEAMF